MPESRIIKKITYKHQCFKDHYWLYDIELYDDGFINYEETDEMYPESDVFAEIPKWFWSKIFKLKDTKRDLKRKLEEITDLKRKLEKITNLKSYIDNYKKNRRAIKEYYK